MSTATKRQITITPEHRRAMWRLAARAHLRDVRAHREAYEAEREHWYTHGDGRSITHGGRGYQFPHCIHGASLWVDHDIPCGFCEEGFTDLEQAAMRAHDTVRDWEARLTVLHAAQAAGAPDAVITPLTAWVVDVLPTWAARPKRHLP